MPESEPLVDKGDTRGSGYFWSVWADWGLVVKTGFGLLLLITLFVFIRFWPELDHQERSFQTALASLPKVELFQPVTQRQAQLLHEGDDYSWRAILWVRENGVVRPKIWLTHVLKQDDGFRCISSELFNYEEALAWSLELYAEVKAGPPPPR